MQSRGNAAARSKPLQWPPDLPGSELLSSRTRETGPPPAGDQAPSELDKMGPTGYRPPPPRKEGGGGYHFVEKISRSYKRGRRLFTKWFGYTVSGCTWVPNHLPTQIQKNFPYSKIKSGTGPWTVTRSSLRMLRRVAAPPPPPLVQAAEKYRNDTILS